MARTRTRKAKAAKSAPADQPAQPVSAQPVIEDDETPPSDERLFIEAEVSGKPFWTAKRLSARRAVRFHNWLQKIAADMSGAIGSIGSLDLDNLAGVNWSGVIGGAASILNEDNYFEILSIASGHTAKEIEANETDFDYYLAWECVADFVELNRLGSVITNFFVPAMNALSLGGEEEQKDQPWA